MNNFDVCIFDLDGTLINSLADLAACVNESLSLHSLPTLPTKQYKYLVGNGINELIKKALGNKADDKELYTSVFSAFNMLYDVKCLEKTRPYIGIDKLLSDLKRNNTKLCVLSNKADKFVSYIVNNLFDEDSFDIIWGKKENYPTKPNPTSILAMLDKLNSAPEKCLYIGDSDVDVITAKNAGVSFCGVEWGFRGKDELKNNGAEIIVKKPEEILNLVVKNA